ncbi:hypothetical protein KDX23_07265 [Burkholderia vietnamiensis]|uniref:hypothetical protein n=1 Tax=Burkholderia vietnamiensis TaxID=60552 RepID=UPI001B950FCB|nr:hypothetical protein [Burkholderia vietnamiensis]MBR8082542.1 hypothetical protein [Burkholderia vietnamiensis]
MFDLNLDPFQSVSSFFTYFFQLFLFILGCIGTIAAVILTVAIIVAVIGTIGKALGIDMSLPEAPKKPEANPADSTSTSASYTDPIL